MCLGPFNEGSDRKDRVVASGAAGLRESDERGEPNAENERSRFPRRIQRGDNKHGPQQQAHYE